MVGWNDVVGIATRYVLDVPEIGSRLGWNFPHPSRPALGSTQATPQWASGLSRGLSGGVVAFTTHTLQRRG